jgi:amidase
MNMRKGMWLVGAALVHGGALAQPSAGPAETATQAALERAQRIDPKVNSILALNPEALAQARALDRIRRARGPLFGVPIVVKDNVDVLGSWPTTAGSRALAANVTNRDAPVVARLRRAGVVIVGKANLSEWANFRSSDSISGWSSVAGQTRNPNALDRNPCGSSSGSGAAVGAGIVDAAVGTETNGSIICPSSVNGIVGLKPTVGLVSRTHIVPISASQDTAGPMAKDVRTAALLLAAMAGSDPADPATAEADARATDYVGGLDGASLKGVRIGVLRWATGWSTPVDAAFERALETLRAQGAVLVDITEGPDRQAIGKAEFEVLLSEFKAGVNAYLATTPPTVKTRTLAEVIAFNKADSARSLGLFGQDLLEKAEATKGLQDPAYLAARATSLKAASDSIAAMLATANAEVLVAPSAPAAWKIDSVNGDQAPFGGAGGLAAVAGTPHLTVPMERKFGLPMGLSFLGPKWSEARLLQLGAAYERARGALPAASLAPDVEGAPLVAPLLKPMLP